MEPRASLTIVALGASAGGPEALQGFFGATLQRLETDLPSVGQVPLGHHWVVHLLPPAQMRRL
jgi:hypothetical protein